MGVYYFSCFLVYLKNFKISVKINNQKHIQMRRKRKLLIYFQSFSMYGSIHSSSDFLVVNFIDFIIPFTWFFTLHYYRVLNIEQLWIASRKQIGGACCLKFKHCMLKWVREKWLWKENKRMINQAKVRCLTGSYNNR